MPRSTVRTGILVALLLGSLTACAEGAEPTTPQATVTTPAPTPAPTSRTPPATEPGTPGPDATNGTTVLRSPVDGQVVDGPTVTVTGEATAFEGTLSWVVYPEGGSLESPSQQGSTMTGANGEIAPFELTVDLEPGRWTIEVFEASAKDGEPLRAVRATVTVR